MRKQYPELHHRAAGNSHCHAGCRRCCCAGGCDDDEQVRTRVEGDFLCVIIGCLPACLLVCMLVCQSMKMNVWAIVRNYEYIAISLIGQV